MNVDSEVPWSHELTYDAVERTPRGFVVAAFQYVTFPLICGIVLSRFGGMVALLGIIATVGLACWHRRSAPRESVILRVDHDHLQVVSSDRRKELAFVGLADLADVVLDVKQIRRVTDGAEMIGPARFATPVVGPEIDTARIVLVQRKGATFPLSLAYLAHVDAIADLARVRLFLREEGWRPAGERRPRARQASIGPISSPDRTKNASP